ncbi:hypothetical protein [Micromonospora aurantiaca (nom. illeg.)]|uniref:hypothetical protein n=1 Tax=Micromonospora aurantiaca (nom. illeg.) TaxID=47850 RepID=UPI00340EBA69
MTALPGQHPPAAVPPVAGRPADEDLRTLFGESIAVFAALAGPTHVVEAANPAFFTAIGEERARTGVALAELMPELDGQAARSTSRRQSSTCVRSSSPTRNSAAWPPTSTADRSIAPPAAASRTARDLRGRGGHARVTA